MAKSKPKLTYREYLILSYYRRGQGEDWLPPNDATEQELSYLVSLDLLRRADAPNADCFAITATGITAFK